MAQTKAQLVVGLNVNASAPASALQIDASGNVNLDSNTLYVDATNNRVGIGTSSPAAQFVVGSGNTLLGHNTLDNYGGRVDIRSAYQARAANTAAQLFVADSAGSQSINTGGAIDLGGYQDSFSRAYSYARIQGLASSSTGYGGYLSFMTQNAGGSIAERLRIDSSGNVGIGTSSPSTRLHVASSISTLPSPEDFTTTVGYFNNTYLNTSNGSTAYTVLRLRREGEGGVAYASTADFAIARYEASGTNSRTRLDLRLGHAGTNTTDTTVASFLSSGNVGIGRTSPTTRLNVGFVDTDQQILRFTRNDDAIGFEIGYVASDGLTTLGTVPNWPVAFKTGATERARIDTSGRLLVGTSSDLGGGISNRKIQVASDNGGFMVIARDDSSIVSGDAIGAIEFIGRHGGNTGRCADIFAYADADHGTNDYPGRLVFSTTADGASSPTQRMQITSGGSVDIGTSLAGGSGITNIYPNDAAGGLHLIRTGGFTCSIMDRQLNDGTLIVFRQASTEEGSISVSGTTVSYNGAHLSRWSQIPGIDPHDKDQRPEILRGTVMSNLDEMCDWINPESGEAQDNEQLNKTKISDVDDDPNVAGVFQSWDDDDDTWVNDYYLAMTGDFVIRIAEGVTVQRGDLLVSAGDGTARPQGDRYLKDSTIAKVTSTNVSCTYDDGSYCVPCVLMAC